MSPFAVSDATSGPAVMVPKYERVTPALLAQIRGEFLEMPGLQLTLRQASRLWNLDALVCDIALRVLLDEQFLDRTRQGHYRRAE